MEIFKNIFKYLRFGIPKLWETPLRRLYRTPIEEVAHPPIDFGDAADPIILGLLDNPDPTVRSGAIRIIRKRGLRDALPRVIEALSDTSGDVRLSAAQSLVSIGDESAIPALIRSISNDGSIRSISNDFYLVLVRRYAREALKALGVPAVRALSDALGADNPAIRLASINFLRSDAVGCPELLSGLVAGLRNELTEVRLKAAKGLERLEDPGAAPYLLAALDDPDTSVQQSVLSALAVCGDATALPRVMDAWRDPNPEVQRVATRTLCKIGNESILPEVLKALDDPEGPRRVDAVEILAAVAGQHANDPLIGVLRDDAPAVRRAAAVALGHLGDPEAVPALVNLLASPNENDREAAAHALGTLGDPEAVPALVAALNDQNDEIRYLAAVALGDIGDVGAVSGLTEALADPDRLVRYEVILALGQIGDAAAVAPLLKQTAAKDGLIRAAACKALGQIGDAAALSRLRKLTKDRQSYIEPGYAYCSPPIVGSAANNALRKIELAQKLKTARFSTYYPKEVRPGDWYGLHAFAFAAGAAEQVAADARRLVAEWEAGHRVAETEGSHPIGEGTPITMTPALEGFQFNPPSQTLGFYEDWHRFDFKLRADAERAGKASNGSLAVRLEGILVADIDLSIYVQKPNIAPAPLLAAKSEGPPGAAAVTCTPYRAIFCSYSRRDHRVVRRVEIACRTLGIKYLRDVVSLPSGEPWAPALLEMIERADVFQLFWSKNSCASEYVEKEWKHALGLGREDRRFIRPVYWAEPMPPAPEELQHLNFAFIPDLAQKMGRMYDREP